MISTFKQLYHNGMAPRSVWRHQPTFIAYWLRLTTSCSSKCMFIYFKKRWWIYRQDDRRIQGGNTKMTIGFFWGWVVMVKKMKNKIKNNPFNVQFKWVVLCGEIICNNSLSSQLFHDALSMILRNLQCSWLSKCLRMNFIKWLREIRWISPKKSY